MSGESSRSRVLARASLALRVGDFAQARQLYDELAKLEPKNPIWPERRAMVCGELGRVDEQIESLLRAVECFVDAHEIIKAIAACKQILDIDPDHATALESLELLYMQPGSSSAGTGSAALGQGAGPIPSIGELAPSSASDAPLEEVLLTEVIPDARPVHVADVTQDGIHEIPIDNDVTGTLDLRLDRSSPAEGLPQAAKSARERLARTPLFGSLVAASLNHLIKRSKLVQLDAGEMLFREGDAPNALYVVIEGAVVPIAEGETRRRLSVLEEGEFFGEIGVVTNLPRTATIEAMVPTRLLAIDRAVMWSLVRSEPEVFRVLLRFFRERLIDTQMKTSAFFRAFLRAERSAVARQFRFLEIQPGARPVETGVASEGLFVLLCGELCVVDEDTDKTLETLRSGDLFGGRSLVERRPAHATVVAQSKAWVLLLPESRFRKIADANPGFEDYIEMLAR